MEFRPAIPADIPGIVEVLRQSLGDALLPKSEQTWRWKHQDNVFGQSYVLLAIEERQIVGVRPFMRWNWKSGQRVIRSVRAVDTAIHPQFQGKGIFSKLTSQLVKDCASDGVEFVFNTPNEKSRPGYLKLGWKTHGRMVISVRPRFPASQVSKFDEKYAIPSNITASDQDRGDDVHTDVAPGFLSWRYVTNPLARYHYVSARDCQIFFRLKSHRFGREMRVCDVVGKPDDESREVLLTAAKDAGALFISFSDQQLPLSAFHLRRGPHVTIRQLSANHSIDFNLWKPSLGDLELF